MAVYQGARARPVCGRGSSNLTRLAVSEARVSAAARTDRAVPRRAPLARRAPRPAAGRRAVRPRVRAARVPAVGGRLAARAIVVAFMLAFFSLAQTVRVTATSYDIDRLAATAATASRRSARRLCSDLNRLGSEPAIRKQAIDAGLAQLGEPLVLPGALMRVDDECSVEPIRAAALLVLAASSS